jgi:hypothetical protein
MIAFPTLKVPGSGQHAVFCVEEFYRLAADEFKY